MGRRFATFLRQGAAAGLPALVTRAAGLGGVLLLALSLVAPWFEIPVAVSAAGEGLTIAGQRPGAELWFKIAVVVVLGALLALFLQRAPQRHAVRVLATFSAALVFFPCAVTLWCPDTAGPAAWLHAQHESLVATTGDLYLAQEDKDAFWRQRVPVTNRAIESAIVRLPDWGAHGARWSRLPEITQWFGASSWFASFVAMGWPLAITGGALALLALARESGGDPLATAAQTLRWMGASALALLPFAAAPPLAAIAQLATAERAVHHERPRLARAALECAARWMPALRADARFLRQLGALDLELECETERSRLWSATELETRGLVLQSRTLYLDLLEDPQTAPAIARECSKALLRQAIDALNSAEVELAEALLVQVLSRDPCNVKGRKTLQLAQLRRGDWRAATAGVRDLTAIYRRFNHPTKSAVLADAAEVAALAQFEHGDVPQAWDTWRLARRR